MWRASFNSFEAVNALPGSTGTMQPGYYQSPGAVRLDINVLKRERITGKVRMDLRGDAISALNEPNFPAPIRAVA